MERLTLNQEQIKEIMPHREPMLLVDEALQLEPGSRIKTKFYVNPEMEIFKGHFPGAPILPGIYTVEIMAQTSNLLLLSTERYAGTIPYFLGLDKVKFIQKILPGDTVEARSQIAAERVEKAIVTCRAEVYNRGQLACSGEVTIALR